MLNKTITIRGRFVGGKVFDEPGREICRDKRMPPCRVSPDVPWLLNNKAHLPPGCCQNLDLNPCCELELRVPSTDPSAKQFGFALFYKREPVLERACRPLILL